MNNITELALAIFRIPGVEDAHLHLWHDLDKRNIGPEAGTSGARKYAHEVSTTFRVWLTFNGKFSGDIQRPSLTDAVRDAFAAAGISMAEVKRKTRALYDTHKLRKPKPPKGDKDKDAIEAGEEWKRTCRGFEETLQLLETIIV